MTELTGNSGKVAVIILTKDEEIHIRRCIENVRQISDEIYVVDSESTDRTCEIAASLGAEVAVNPWPGSQALQFNWALEHLPVKAEWIMRLDADETLSPQLVDEINSRLPSVDYDISGFTIPRTMVYLGKALKRGGMGNIRILRLFRRGKGRSEQRLMDEHIQVSDGRIAEMKGAFADNNLHNLSWWTQKHIGYAIREAVELLDLDYNLTGASIGDADRPLSGQAHAKRMKKHKYARLPLFWRATAYFLYRYILRGGFLEGKEGFLWHFLQGWWYRILVDAKVLEIKRKSGGDRKRMLEILKNEYNIEL